MIADIPARVLTLIVNPEPIKAPSGNPEGMRSLIAKWKAEGLSNDSITDIVDRRIKRYLETVGHRSQGERNATAYRVARWLVNDFDASDNVAWGYLREWNQGNTPPLSARELTLVMKSAKSAWFAW